MSVLSAGLLHRCGVCEAAGGMRGCSAVPGVVPGLGLSSCSSGEWLEQIPFTI